MRYYAIADIHGRFDLLKKAFEAITEHAVKNQISEPSKIITLGDYIDRGPESRQVIEFLKDKQDGSQLGSSLICLQGNHEAMMLETILTPLMPSWWVGNGGDKTLNSYGWQEPYHLLAYEVIPRSHLEWLKNLPLFYEAEKQVFVHAGIPQWGMNLPPSSKQLHKVKRLEEQMQWMLYGKTDSGGWKGKHVVHGHHQFEDGPHTWHSVKGGRTDLDCWAYHTGRLVIGVFDDTQLHAIEYLEVTDGREMVHQRYPFLPRKHP